MAEHDPIGCNDIDDALDTPSDEALRKDKRHACSTCSDTVDVERDYFGQRRALYIIEEMSFGIGITRYVSSFVSNTYSAPRSEGLTRLLFVSPFRPYPLLMLITNIVYSNQCRVPNMWQAYGAWLEMTSFWLLA